MKRYLKFVASFWMSAFLIAGSMAGAQTTPTVKAKKNGSSTTTPAPAINTTNSSQSTTTTNAGVAPQTNVTAHDQSNGASGTTTTPATTTPAPKTMIGPDKHTILVPQL